MCSEFVDKWCWRLGGNVEGVLGIFWSLAIVNWVVLRVGECDVAVCGLLACLCVRWWDG